MNPEHRRLSARKRLLAKGGVEERRLRNARHMAATMLVLLDVPEHGHVGAGVDSDGCPVPARDAAVRRGVAGQIGGLLWKPSGTQSCNHNGNGRAALTGGPARVRW